MKLSLKIIGEDGNIFNILSIARRALKEEYRKNGEEKYEKMWQELSDRIYEAETYEEALSILGEYFTLE